MPRLSLLKLVVAFLTREGKAMSLDLLARVSVLEGIARVKPGTWMKKVPSSRRAHGRTPANTHPGPISAPRSYAYPR